MKHVVLFLLALALRGQAPVNTLIATSTANFEQGLPPPVESHRYFARA